MASLSNGVSVISKKAAVERLSATESFTISLAQLDVGCKRKSILHKLSIQIKVTKNSLALSLEAHY